MPCALKTVVRLNTLSTFQQNWIYPLTCLRVWQEGLCWLRQWKTLSLRQISTAQDKKLRDGQLKERLVISSWKMRCTLNSYVCVPNEVATEEQAHVIDMMREPFEDDCLLSAPSRADSQGLELSTGRQESSPSIQKPCLNRTIYRAHFLMLLYAIDGHR